MGNHLHQAAKLLDRVHETGTATADDLAALVTISKAQSVAWRTVWHGHTIDDAPNDVRDAADRVVDIDRALSKARAAVVDLITTPKDPTALADLDAARKALKS